MTAGNSRFILLFLTLIALAPSVLVAQVEASFRVVKIQPFDKAVPGEILELRVEGLGGGPPAKLLPPEDFQVEVSQDGATQQARLRGVLPTLSREPNSDGTPGEMKPFQSVSFVVPHGLHPGAAQVVLVYKDKRGTPSAPPAGTRITDMGWRFERDSKVQLYLKPLVDPDDPGAAVLIKFKQSNQTYDATARVIYEPQRTERTARGVAFLPPRDFLQIEIPPALAMGPADMEIRLRANGAESDPISVKVQISDTTRSAEGPVINAPRVLNVTPRKVGAGQGLMLSIDYLRTLNPDPAQTLILIEHDTARYFLKPESNSALRMPNKAADAPVMLIVRPTREIIGPAQIRVLNSLKGEQGGTSPAIPIEIVDDVLPPEILSANESTDADLAHLRDTFEIQRAAGHPFNAYDPDSRYLTIRGRGIDPNPRFVRIVLEQNGQSTALALADISSISPELLIVRLPKTATAGPAKASVANVGLERISQAAAINFELH
ncbi:MAG: hypothetical protein DMF72_08905 [Acidobacteria bacterium]|nr:MAG: hypothetical protein DMF72_08905 [Acidobacteriota bacterium]